MLVPTSPTLIAEMKKGMYKCVCREQSKTRQLCFAFWSCFNALLVKTLSNFHEPEKTWGWCGCDIEATGHQWWQKGEAHDGGVTTVGGVVHAYVGQKLVKSNILQFFTVTDFVSVTVTLLYANTMLNRNQLLLSYSTRLDTPTNITSFQLTPSDQFDVSCP
jgi:hypothetical protein